MLVLKHSFAIFLVCVCLYQISGKLGELAKEHTAQTNISNEKAQITLNNSNQTIIQLPISDLDRIILIDEAKFRYQGKSYKLVHFTIQAEEGKITVVGVADGASERINKPFLKKKSQPVKKDPTLAKRRMA